MIIDNSRKTTAKQWFIKTALTYLGTPYIWGGDDPSGFDCSGFVVECLKSVGLLAEHEDYTADGLYNLLKLRSKNAEINIAKTASEKQTDVDIASNKMTGLLIFRFAKNGCANHVVICLDRWYQIGASGGRRSTITTEKSWDANAFVKIRPIGEIGNNIRFINPFA